MLLLEHAVPGVSGRVYVFKEQGQTLPYTSAEHPISSNLCVVIYHQCNTFGWETHSDIGNTKCKWFPTVSKQFHRISKRFTVYFLWNYKWISVFRLILVMFLYTRERYIPHIGTPKLIGKCKRPRKWTALEQYVFLDTKNLIKLQKWMKLDEFESAMFFMCMKNIIGGRVWLRSLSGASLERRHRKTSLSSPLPSGF